MTVLYGAEQEAWPLQPELCPADIEFTEWLNGHYDGPFGLLLHIGTGGHHRVGIWCYENHPECSVLGITASIAEMCTYMDLALAMPSLIVSYRVLWGDVYALDARLLPSSIDVLTLFHIGECIEAERSAYGGKSNEALLEALLPHVVSGGHVLFYVGSYGWPRIQDELNSLVIAERLRKVEEYKHLSIFERIGIA